MSPTKPLAGLLALALLCGPAAAADSVIKIGVLTDMSGPNSDLAGAGSVLAARLAAEDGERLFPGKKIEVVSADHQNKADIASSIASRWFDIEGVDVIVDVPFSSAALAVQEVARRREKVVLFSGPGSSDLTGKACSATSFHWAYDTQAVANGTAGSVTKAGGDTWFFLTSDYAFGHALERDARAVVIANGGKVLGSVRHPVYTPDFSSFLLQAQNSKAKVIGLANAATDAVNTIRQASEFGIVENGQQLAGLLVFLTDVHSLGLQAAKKLRLTESFYWDQNDATRDWSKRFSDRFDERKPTMVHAGVYSAVNHYLKAVADVGSTDGKAVASKMHATPVSDFMTKNANILPNGWVDRDFYLFEVKSPSESKGAWDYYKLVATIPAVQAKPRVALQDCPISARAQ
ncbi:ABC transporter substrate-binding protein [Xanthobacter autotrophicus DSM 431]|uniref:ABC transporter substrate-binding protein n=1 Tax=Xanthobacter nonsaccharivorans TaxID=3119912 RepID=UPI003726962C